MKMAKKTIGLLMAMLFMLNPFAGVGITNPFYVQVGAVTEIPWEDSNNLPSPISVKPLDIQEPLTLGVGETYQATVESGNTTWSTSDRRIADINNDGLIIAKAVGRAVVTAENSGSSRQFIITVKQAPNSIETCLVVLSGYHSIIPVLPGKTASHKITFSVSDPSVLEVSADGGYTFKKNGSCVVTVTTFNGIKYSINFSSDYSHSGTVAAEGRNNSRDRILAGPKGIYIVAQGERAATQISGDEISYDYTGFLTATDWIYYRNLSDNGYLYRINFDGTKKSRVTSESFTDFQLDGDWVYYRQGVEGSNSEYSQLSRVKTDGTNAVRLISERYSDYRVDENWVYYSLRGDSWNEPSRYLARVRTDGTNRTMLISERYSDYQIEGNWVYYTLNADSSDESRHLTRVKLDGSDRTRIITERFKNHKIDNNWIYFISSRDNYLYRIRPDGTREAMVSSEACSSYEISGDWIYYWDLPEKNQYRVSIDGFLLEWVETKPSEEISAIVVLPDSSDSEWVIDTLIVATDSSDSEWETDTLESDMWLPWDDD